MKALFDEFDEDGNGSINAMELEKLFDHLLYPQRCHLGPSDLQDMINGVDEDKDGEINFEEMQKMFHKQLQTEEVQSEGGEGLTRLVSKKTK